MNKLNFSSILTWSKAKRMANGLSRFIPTKKKGKNNDMRWKVFLFVSKFITTEDEQEQDQDDRMRKKKFHFFKVKQIVNKNYLDKTMRISVFLHSRLELRLRMSEKKITDAQRQTLNDDANECSRILCLYVFFLKKPISSAIEYVHRLEDLIMSDNRSTEKQRRSNTYI